jgi:hypothetical protein
MPACPRQSHILTTRGAPAPCSGRPTSAVCPARAPVESGSSARATHGALSSRLILCLTMSTLVWCGAAPAGGRRSVPRASSVRASLRANISPLLKVPVAPSTYLAPRRAAPRPAPSRALSIAHLTRYLLSPASHIQVQVQIGAIGPTARAGFVPELGCIGCALNERQTPRMLGCPESALRFCLRLRGMERCGMSTAVDCQFAGHMEPKLRGSNKGGGTKDRVQESQRVHGGAWFVPSASTFLDVLRRV